MRTRAVSIVELIIAFVILGLIAALTVPVFSRAAESPLSTQLRTDLTTLRTAIALYYRDHGVYPGNLADSPTMKAPADPAAIGTLVQRQLLEYTNAAGNPAVQSSAEHSFGPYLRAGFPACGVSPQSRAAVWVIAGGAAPGYVPEAAGFGWIYDRQTGFIVANSNLTDSHGRRYDWY